MLHPVGSLPAAVYWRRRLLVLVGLVGVLGGGGWLGTSLVTGSDREPDPVVAGATTDAPAAPPALEQVVPALAAVQVPTAAPTTVPAPTSAPPAAVADETPPGPVSGGSCTDDMITVDVRPDPASAPTGSKPAFDLVVTNVSAVACTVTLDKAQEEIILVDGAGNRVWGSNDCYPENGSESHLLQPGEAAASRVLWSGLSSAPGCAGQRVTPGPGSYVLRGRLDAKTGADAPFTLT